MVTDILGNQTCHRPNANFEPNLEPHGRTEERYNFKRQSQTRNKMILSDKWLDIDEHTRKRIRGKKR